MKCGLLISIIILPFTTSLSSSCDSICPHNEVFSMKVSQCQSTCWSQNLNSTGKCKALPGCACKRGYIRHPDTYKCVLRQSCPTKTNHAQCPKNEVYTICTGYSGVCEASCQHRDEKNCDCKSNCRCKKGFARSSITHQCISIASCEKCPTGFSYDKVHKKCSLNCTQSCPEHQTFTQCGSSCRELKCPLSENESSLVCTQECIAGCFCSNGYRRDLLSNKCVLSHECTQCPENESYRCDNPLCETTCDTINEKFTKYPIRCEEKCYCIDGYVRAVEGSQCVPKHHCPIINRDV